MLLIDLGFHCDARLIRLVFVCQWPYYNLEISGEQDDRVFTLAEQIIAAMPERIKVSVYFVYLSRCIIKDRLISLGVSEIAATMGSNATINFSFCFGDPNEKKIFFFHGS